MKPLEGLRIVVTRDRRGAAELAQTLEALGAEAIVIPLIELKPPADPAPLARAVEQIEKYDWILFTSANAVRFFLEAGVSIKRPRVCAIGPATRAALEERGVAVELVPSEYVAEGVVAAFEREDLRDARVLLPRAAVARDLVPEALAARGALVDVVEVYRNVVPENAGDLVERAFAAHPKPDWVTFASSSAVKNFLAAASRATLDGVLVASIGPATSSVLQMHGLAVTVEAKEHTAGGIVDAIRSYSSTSTSTSHPSTSE